MARKLIDLTHSNSHFSQRHMKTAAKFLALAFVAFGFSSCCNIGLCGDSPKKKVKETVTEYEQVEVEGAKGVTYESRPVTKTVCVDKGCEPCTYHRCVERTCCGGLADEFVNRATVQPSTGGPHMGLIPTMKKLAR